MVELIDIIAPAAAPPAPPPYAWIAFGVVVLLLILFFALHGWGKRTRVKRLAYATLKRAEKDLVHGKGDARRAVFQIAQAVQYHALPQKGDTEEQGEWAEFRRELDRARFSADAIDVPYAAQLLKQARHWIGRTQC